MTHDATERVRVQVVALLLTLLLLAGCTGRNGATEGSGTASGLRISVALTPQPPAVGPARVAVQLTDAQGNPVDGATVSVEGDMTHAGMTPVLATAQPQGDGSYVAEGFQFTMGGDWVLTVKASLPDGRTAQQVVAVNGVGGQEAPGGMDMATPTMGGMNMDMATATP